MLHKASNSIVEASDSRNCKYGAGGLEMKRSAAALLSLLLILSILCSCAPAAFADGQINNRIKGSGSYTTPSATGRELFYSASNSRKVEAPHANDYYVPPFTMYVNAQKGHSVYVYDYWSAVEEHKIGTAFHGSRVTVLAQRNDLYCILFHEQDYQLKVAWVSSGNLSSYYPGDAFYVGSGSNWYDTNIGDPSMHWSRDCFVGTGRRYSVLDTPVSRCTGFTLDYHVTARNGSQTYDVLGPRDVYVNDGSGWIWVCSFDLQELVPCHVYITLPSQMTVAAVATIASCRDPNTCIFRQSLLDVMCG